MPQRQMNVHKTAYARLTTTPPRHPPNAPNLEQVDWFSSLSARTRVQMLITGAMGPAPMAGVLAYPFSPAERLYHEDFAVLVARTLDHPYMITTKASTGSTPHDLLAASAYTTQPRWQSEHMNAYQPQSYIQSKSMLAAGIRSEQL